MYIGWATNVNKVIIDSSSVTVGEGAVIEDGLEAGGQKKKRLISANPPDKYSVTMNFNFVDKDENGLTELERFYSWYKFSHCYGVNPFLFPAILINSNRQEGEGQEDVEHIIQRIANGDPTARLPDNEYYIITSAIEGSKSGTELQITMTWETYATGAFTIPDEESEVIRIEAHNGYIDVILTSVPSTEPIATTWTVYVKKDNGTESEQTITGCYYDGDVTAKLFFNQKVSNGTYTMRIDDLTSHFTVGD